MLGSINMSEMRELLDHILQEFEETQAKDAHLRSTFAPPSLHLRFAMIDRPRNDEQNPPLLEQLSFNFLGFIMLFWFVFFAVVPLCPPLSRFFCFFYSVPIPRCFQTSSSIDCPSTLLFLH